MYICLSASVLHIIYYVYRDRLDYSIHSDAYNADLDAHCIFLYHNLCFAES